ncbi:curli-like amyloid fiber formation chaperone CsgH [Devosia nitrariae]|uniref:CsgH-like domain-containing protein n=1 Tax=Devosia nitrariae TaxID=2071872 RepID=A0ABQ5VYE4_9HYPH|nr:curli-like amyloid fiber formation chaperone CsgH [Devosia nitrariae]GLQ52824.1 hypothetical protein GCM10010862_00820 [Devosia nitrariae]
MTRIKGLAALALPVLAGLGGTALAIDAGVAQTQGPLTCAIDVNPKNQMVEIEGVVLADTSISGSYSFEVKSRGPSGNSNIRQGGGFTAEAGKPATLGKVMLGSAGASYDVKLDIDANGESVTCDQRVG